MPRSCTRGMGIPIRMFNLLLISAISITGLILILVGIQETSYLSTLSSTDGHNFSGPVYGIGVSDVIFGFYDSLSNVNVTSGCVPQNGCSVYQSSVNAGTCLTRCPWAWLSTSGVSFFNTCSGVAKTTSVALTAGYMAAVACGCFIFTSWATVFIHRLFAETAAIFTILAPLYGCVVICSMSFAINGNLCGNPLSESLQTIDKQTMVNGFYTNDVSGKVGSGMFLVAIGTSLTGWTMVFWHQVVAANIRRPTAGYTPITD